MAAPLNPAKLDHAIELYLARKPQTEILATTGISATTLDRERTRRGIPPRREHVLPDAEIAAAYLGGESEYSLGLHYGVSRAVIRRRQRQQGVEIRGCSDAGIVRAAQMTPEKRAAQVAAAHAATRGKSPAYESLCLAAQTRERTQPFGSHGERLMSQWLTERGEVPIPQKAIGKYNVDVAVAPVAVEVLGGGWHLKKRQHVQRTPDILDAGWHLVFVWNHEGVSALTEAAADYVIAFLQEVRRNPPAIGQYRVIAGGGQFLTAGGREDDKFPLVPPPRGCAA